MADEPKPKITGYGELTEAEIIRAIARPETF